jgi:hypothetical protein
VSSPFCDARPILITFLRRDIHDVARIHVESLSQNIPGNERYLFNSPEVMAGNLTAQVIRDEFPQLKDRVPAPDKDAGDGLPPSLAQTDISKFEKAFGRQNWKSAKASALEGVADIVAYVENDH